MQINRCHVMLKINREDLPVVFSHRCLSFCLSVCPLLVRYNATVVMIVQCMVAVMSE